MSTLPSGRLLMFLGCTGGLGSMRGVCGVEAHDAFCICIEFLEVSVNMHFVVVSGEVQAEFLLPFKRRSMGYQIDKMVRVS